MTNKSELIQGPLPRFEWDAEDKAVIDRLLASDDELDKVYGEAYSHGFFVKEMIGLAAVGEMETIDAIAFRLGNDSSEVIEDLQIGDLISLGAYPGRGETRAEKVRDSMQKALEKRNRTEPPDELDLYGSFTEKGYIFEALMPRSSEQPTQWTVRVYREGEKRPFRVVEIPMVHEPVFGVDAGDIAVLESKVTEILGNLS